MNHTIKDKIGAMAIVDKLRFQSDRVQDYMDTDKQKAALVEKLKAQYKAENAVVSDEIIEEGVSNWYENRLKIEVNPVPWYISLFISRDKWLVPTLTTAFSFAAFYLLISTAVSFHQGMELEKSSKRLNAGIERIEQLRELADTGHQKFSEEVAEKLQEIDSKIQSLDSKLTFEIDRAKAGLSEAQLPNFDTINKAFYPYRDAVNSKQVFIKTETQFNSSLAEYKALKADPVVEGSEYLKGVVTKIDGLLLLRDNRIPFMSAVGDFRKKIETRKANEFLISESKLSADLAIEQLVNEDEKNIVRALFGRITADYKGGEPIRAQDIKLLDHYAYLSGQALTLVINPDNTGTSGFNRDFSEGGSSFYVVVKAFDKANRPVEMHVESIESGMGKFVDFFAVRVSNVRQSSLRADKAQDGIINDSLAGTKPIGTLRFNLEDGYFNQFIYDW